VLHSYLKNKAKIAKGMVQAGQRLPSKWEALSSNPGQKKKRKEF
jgi:hypothetical protein